VHPARLFVLTGLPGSGKTTRAIELEERFRALRQSADDWMSELDIDIWDEQARARVETIQRDQTTRLLRAGTSIVIEWGT
jgi:predicted kinase